MSEPSGPPDGPSDKDGRTPTPVGGVPAVGVPAVRSETTHGISSRPDTRIASTRHSIRRANGSRSSRSARWASSTATSAPARSTRSRRRSTPAKGHGFPVTRGRGVRRALDDRLVAHHRRRDQVHLLHPAGGQPGRGRRVVAARPSAADGTARRGQAAALDARLARSLRIGAALRRRDDHAGHLRPWRAPGIEVRESEIPHMSIVAAGRGIILLAVFAVQRFGTARVGAAFRADHGRLVRHDRRASACARFSSSRRSSPRSTRVYALRFFVEHGLPGSSSSARSCS